MVDSGWFPVKPQGTLIPQMPARLQEIVKMCMQISALDLTDISVLQDQLTGVDVAYFIEVINKLKEKDPVKVNYAYLVEILDRMF